MVAIAWDVSRPEVESQVALLQLTVRPAFHARKSAVKGQQDPLHFAAKVERCLRLPASQSTRPGSFPPDLATTPFPSPSSGRLAVPTQTTGNVRLLVHAGLTPSMTACALEKIPLPYQLRERAKDCAAVSLA